MAGVQQFDARVAADEAGAAGNENVCGCSLAMMIDVEFFEQVVQRRTRNSEQPRCLRQIVICVVPALA